MENKKITQLKTAYEAVPIPAELSWRVQDAIQESRKASRPVLRVFRGIGGAAVVAALLFTVSLNTIDGLAATLEEVPVLGSIVRVLTFRTFAEKSEEHQYEIDLEVPQISGLENQELERTLNEAYLEEARALYQAFLEEMGGLEEGQLAHRAAESGYEVVVNDGHLLVLRRYKVETAASAMETVDYETVDLEQGVLLTLPSLFTGDGYLEVISENIKEQMRERMAEDESHIYWIAPEDAEGFEAITPDQTFYLDGRGGLVIVFDKYEVTPGYMGVPEFRIPSETLQPLLAGDGYIY